MRERVGFEQGVMKGICPLQAYEGAGPLSKSASSRASATQMPTLSGHLKLARPGRHCNVLRERETPYVTIETLATIDTKCELGSRSLLDPEPH
jgi:hypothetical protein